VSVDVADGAQLSTDRRRRSVVTNRAGRRASCLRDPRILDGDDRVVDAVRSPATCFGAVSRAASSA
jgi:hypothetical protein